MDTENEHQEFWERHTLAHWLARASSWHSPPTAAEQEELDRLLWAFTEGRLESEPEADRLWELASRVPEAQKRLREIYDAIEKVEKSPAADPVRTWNRLHASKPATSQSTGLLDLVIQFAREGLELLQSRGRAAFAPAATRSGQEQPPTSIAQEFLTSAGTFQVVIDRQDAGTYNLTVTARTMKEPLDADDLDLEIRDASDTSLRAEPFEEGRARLEALPAGRCDLVIVSDSEELARLKIDLRTRG
jgi:hypothetical protein